MKRRAYRIKWRTRMPPDDSGDTELLGLCDRRARTIFLARELRQSPGLLSEVAVHETIHEHAWGLSEAQVHRMARAIARRLRKMGISA